MSCTRFGKPLPVLYGSHSLSHKPHHLLNMIFTRTFVAAVLALAPVISANGLSERANTDFACPATNNGQDRNYVAHTFTAGQAKAAVAAASKYQNKMGEKWKPGRDEYPHFFGNGEQIPFPCGAQKAEYPIKTDGKVFPPPTGDVGQIPDRVVYEYAWVKKNGKKTLQVGKICGVMRHGPGRDFLNCPGK
ncbi:unnamed protein product [Clonostachys byssicola]|uniref:Uncharacterized protein n=1 Tax=Clonostachys byssicola TaxID=160290 RepID=A0A9N9U922_9HYPO|nr:unnamed protein product [Clonostachys byssicola]